MLKLTKKDLSNIAERYIGPYLSDHPDADGVDMISFAKDYLGMNIRYGEMSSDVDDIILAVTAFCDTVFHISEDEFYLLSANDILLNEELMTTEMEGRRNFTIAHECAHQILKKTFPLYFSADIRKMRSKEIKGGPRTEDDWYEWQADCIASCILMPKVLIEKIMQRYSLMPMIRLCPCMPLLYKDMTVVEILKNKMKVSSSAVVKRLNDIGKVRKIDIKEYIYLSNTAMRPLGVFFKDDGEGENAEKDNFGCEFVRQDRQTAADAFAAAYQR